MHLQIQFLFILLWFNTFHFANLNKITKRTVQPEKRFLYGSFIEFSFEEDKNIHIKFIIEKLLIDDTECKIPILVSCIKHFDNDKKIGSKKKRQLFLFHLLIISEYLK